MYRICATTFYHSSFRASKYVIKNYMRSLNEFAEKRSMTLVKGISLNSERLIQLVFLAGCNALILLKYNPLWREEQSSSMKAEYSNKLIHPIYLPNRRFDRTDNTILFPCNTDKTNVTIVYDEIKVLNQDTFETTFAFRGYVCVPLLYPSQTGRRVIPPQKIPFCYFAFLYALKHT